MNEQDIQLARVQASLDEIVESFVRERLASGRDQFHMCELNDYVQQRIKAAPGSAERVFRALRQVGTFGYRVLNRKQSHYQLFPQRVVQRELF